MTTLQLKKILINQINDIDDVAFLNEIKSIIDSKFNQQIFKLTAEQRKEINASKRDFRNGNLIAQSELDKEVAKLANEKETGPIGRKSNFFKFSNSMLNEIRVEYIL